jgi:hypothetical protein
MSGRPSNLRVLAVTLSACATIGAGPLRFKGKPFLTYPMPPKETPEDPLRIFPAMQVPEDPQRYIWTLKAPKFSADIKEVPVFRFDERLKPIKVGSLPLGTTVKLEKFMAHGKSNFYSIPWKNSNAWVNGVFIAPTGFAAPGQ